MADPLRATERRRARAKQRKSRNPFDDDDERQPRDELIGDVRGHTDEPDHHQQTQFVDIKQTDRSNKEILQSTLSMVAQAQADGVSVNASLERQGEQLARVDRALSDANTSLSASERTIRGIKSLGGAFYNFMTRPKPLPPQTYPHPIPPTLSGPAGRPTPRPATEKSIAPLAEHKDDAAVSTLDKSLSQQHQVDSRSIQRQEEDEMLDELCGGVDVLKNLALKAGQELKRQNGLIDHIDREVDYTASRIKRNTRSLDSIS